MTVLLTGIDGYLGYPTARRIVERIDERVVGVDNLARREWVEEVGSVSAVPIESMDERFNDLPSVSVVEADLADRAVVDSLLDVHEPETVIHTAAQPSAPYSQINGERANETQHNNLQATRNLLWGLHEHGLSDTHFIETTTTGQYGAPEFPIPEGGALMEHQGGRDFVPFPSLGGSWYHQTKGFDAANMRLAQTQFGLPISDVRTAIVYGSETPETADSPTRFDFDYYFGTVAHRFCAQAVAGYPVTVYGKGEQRKPFIALEDAVEGLVRLAEMDQEDRPDDLTVYNQVTRPISIVEIATTIADVGAEFGLDVAVEHFENPRDEDETHKMEIENDRYLDLIGGQGQTFEEGVRDILGTLVEYEDRITAREDRFLPGVLSE